MSESRGEIPKKIDRYEIIEAIGFGAMGAVYKAFDPLIKRPVAVKTLRLDVPPQSPDYKAFLDRFATEARTAGRLSHPNIITLYDVGHTEDQVPWLAMEYVAGQTVAELLEGERLRPEVVVGIVSQIAAAVDYAHSEGVIHRDIKPSNVIVYGGEKVKVTDFGIAKLMDAEITHSGLMMGTPSYMSPEQAMGEDLDGRTDIFSLGVVAFEMLSGQQPFPGNNVTSILYKLVHSDPVHPEDLEILGLLPDKWHQVFTRVLAKDPAERFPTAAAFVQQLEHCLGSWFGALEGETVVVKDPAKLIEGQGSGTETLLPVDAESSKNSPDSDETVIVPPESPAGGEGLDGATATLRSEAIFDDQRVETVTNAPSPAIGGEETVYAPPPEGDGEETLYAGDADETLRAFDAADETVIDPQTVAPPPARVGRGFPSRRKLALAGGGAILALTILLSVILAGGDIENVAVPEPVPPPQPPVVEAGSLAVTSDPEGATVIVNGEERGSTPLEIDELPLSPYEIVVERAGFHPEELTAELTVAEPRASFEVSLRRKPPPAPAPAFVRIASTPPGAQVEIDGKPMGTTPTDPLRVSAGERTVRIVQDGFLPWEDTVRALSGQTVDLDAVLTARGGGAGAPDAPPPEPTTPEVEVGALVERGEPGVENPECIECPPVRYPEAARQNRLEGVVELSFIIDENGDVTDVEVQRSAGEIFDPAVVDAVRQWRWEPATKHGVPVKIRWVQRFRFRRGR